ncbi:hypothetical protein ABFS82_07G004300 [Erythranthe guttata]|uniref:Uncharacterized protein n=1 Tax=Erythranthe guttata TaxID=4155 RepID=A0A022QT73_ERYGU|nr:hypothetical protein MIMGU_mgv1a017252mg [Erythranthe guttata]
MRCGIIITLFVLCAIILASFEGGHAEEIMPGAKNRHLLRETNRSPNKGSEANNNNGVDDEGSGTDQNTHHFFADSNEYKHPPIRSL